MLDRIAPLEWGIVAVLALWMAWEWHRAGRAS